jgi:hypothetical protein
MKYDLTVHDSISTMADKELVLSKVKLYIHHPVPVSPHPFKNHLC